MVSDAELVQRLREFLRSSDLSTTTTAIIRRRLEDDFGVNLSDKKAFIREQVDIFLGELNDQPETEDAAEQAVKEVEEKDQDGLREGEEDEQGEEEEEEEEEEGGSGEGSDDEDEEEDEDDEKNNEGGSRKRKSNKVKMEVKKRGGGFTKLCSLSPMLQEFLGESELARTEVVKRLWAYIREKNLQDPNNRRKIICDDRLQPLFNVNSIDMFQMNKALSKHIWPLDSESAGPVTPAKTKQNSKKPKKEKEGKRQKGGSSGFLVPIPLSDDLVKFFGTGENSLSRADVVKRMWDYIKGNNLQDPADRRNVICDEKLKELFKVDSFHGFSVSKLLAPHFIKENQ